MGDSFDYNGKSKIVQSSLLKVVEECTGVPLDELSTNDTNSAVEIIPVVVSQSMSSAVLSDETESVCLLSL